MKKSCYYSASRERISKEHLGSLLNGAGALVIAAADRKTASSGGALSEGLLARAKPIQVFGFGRVASDFESAGCCLQKATVYHL